MSILQGIHPLKQLTDAWLGKIRRAEEAKAPFQEIADECNMFFSAATGFLWDPKYAQKFWNQKDGPVNPRFKLTIAKAYELVALFGPVLYWRNPIRTAKPREPMEIEPDVQLKLLGIDPQQYYQAQQVLQQWQQQQQQAPQQGMQQQQPAPPEVIQAAMFVQQVSGQLQQIQQAQADDALHRRTVADAMKRYLNWTPFELELHKHAQSAITEALIKGRGVLWQETYTPPGSDRTMVGSFYDTVDNLFIDPDAESLDTAWWIVKRCTHPVWYVERKAKLPPDSLKGLGNRESFESQSEREANPDATHEQVMGQAQDLMVYYKIWSRCGPGTKLTGIHPNIKHQLDGVVGDYCYLEVADGVPFPLNLPSQRLIGGANDEVRRAFAWPTPHWRDGKWPCAVLDFQSKPRSAWPIAPLAPGLGELKAINVLLSHLCNRIWTSSRDLVAVLESAADQVEEVLKKGEDLAVMRLADGHGSLDNVVSFLQHPPTNFDVWKILDALLQLFDKRVGLTELVYGLNPGGKQERSATGAQIKQQNMSVRPDHMASQVEQWMTDAALREALTIRFHVQGRDVADLLGPMGVQVWDRYIVNTPVERTVRDIDYRIEAGTAKKPNRQRDVGNVNEALPILGPILQQREQVTGDFGPINALIQKWGDAVEMDTSAMQAQSPPPQPDPAEAQAQLEMQQKQQEMQLDQQQHQVDQQQDQEKHTQEMTQDQQQHVLEMTQAQQKGTLDLRLAKQKSAAQAAAVRSRPKPKGNAA